MSPTIFREAGFRFYFFSRYEVRRHVHVAHADGEAKFWLEPTIALATSTGLNSSKLANALELSGTMNLKSVGRGKNTSSVEVTNISSHGFWLLLEDAELFLPFEHFPWFRGASVDQICHVELPASDHLYWPDLDIDVSIESIRQPEQFPLMARHSRTRL